MVKMMRCVAATATAAVVGCGLVACSAGGSGVLAPSGSQATSASASAAASETVTSPFDVPDGYESSLQCGAGAKGVPGIFLTTVSLDDGPGESATKVAVFRYVGTTRTPSVIFRAIADDGSERRLAYADGEQTENTYTTPDGAVRAIPAVVTAHDNELRAVIPADIAGSFEPESWRAVLTVNGDDVSVCEEEVEG